MEGTESGERFVRVIVQAASFRCEASVALPVGGYRGRVLDLLNSDASFLALTDVLLYRPEEGLSEDPEHEDVILLRKDEIQFIIPVGAHW
jgi:hypothetical protein